MVKRINLVLLALAALLLVAGKVPDVTTFMKSVHFRNGQAGYMTFASNCVTQATNSGTGTQVVTGVFPARVLPLGLTARVNVALDGASLTTWSIGDGTDVDLYGGSLAKTAGTKVETASYTARPTTQAWSTSAGNITLTAAAGQFDSGQVTVCGHYVTFTAPSS